ncbi:MAG: hypothetical protein OXD50_16855 [Chloroflexi bacterium]|nr:hypothetical protein [Chloroflexota bacterium]
MVLEKQVTLITSVSRGFGLATAEKLIDRGHSRWETRPESVDGKERISL